jgi:hypothetical protein
MAPIIVAAIGPRSAGTTNGRITFGLSDIESRFTCQACGQRGADVRPNFHWENEALRGSATISIANNPHSKSA